MKTLRKPYFETNPVVSLGRGSTKTTDRTTTKTTNYTQEPTEWIFDENIPWGEIGWAQQYDLRDAYKKYRAQKIQEMQGMTGPPDPNAPAQGGRDFEMRIAKQFYQDARRPEFQNFLSQQGVAAVPTAQRGGEYWRSIMPGESLSGSYNPGASYQLTNPDGTVNRRAARMMREMLMRARRGEDLPESEEFFKQLETRYGTNREEALRRATRDIDTALIGGSVAGITNNLIPAAYNFSRLLDADKRVKMLKKQDAPPAESSPPQRDLGLATQIGKVQQEAETGMSEMERRALTSQRLTDFNRSVNAITNTGDASNIGAHIASLYDADQRAGLNASIASDNMRMQKRGELAGLLGQQRQQENLINASNERMYGNRLQQYNMMDAYRRSDLGNSQVDRWNSLRDLASMGMNSMQQLGNQASMYPYQRWDSDQAYSRANEHLQKVYGYQPEQPTMPPTQAAAPQQPFTPDVSNSGGLPVSYRFLPNIVGNMRTRNGNRMENPYADDEFFQNNFLTR